MPTLDDQNAGSLRQFLKLFKQPTKLALNGCWLLKRDF